MAVDVLTLPKTLETTHKAGDVLASPRSDRNPKNWLHEFHIKETLGEGSFGKVKLGVHKLTGQKVALKFIDHARIMQTKYATKFHREMEIHKNVDHPNIVKVFQIIEAPPQYQYTCIVMEFLSGEDLLDFVLRGDHGRLDTKTAGKIFSQLLSAVQYLHSTGIVHRDLKLENIMIEPTTLEVKIIDFGFANRWEENSLLKTPCGSPLYASPEILLRRNYIGPETDIWSLGVILYSMLTGTIPWAGENSTEQLYNTVNGRWIVTKVIPFALMDLFTNIFQTDSKRRLTLDEVMQHGWVAPFLSKPTGIRKMMRRLSSVFA